MALSNLHIEYVPDWDPFSTIYSNVAYMEALQMIQFPVGWLKRLSLASSSAI